MQMIPLQASARDQKSPVVTLRRAGKVPGIVYGHKVSKMLVTCELRDLHRAFTLAGESVLVELDVEGKKIPVLFKQVDHHPVSDREIHADFYAVNMDEEIETLVPVHFEGESPAVKTLGGVFVTPHDHVKVRCLPGKLPRFLAVDVSKLEAFHQSVTVKDLDLPEGVKVMNAPETVLATIQEPRAEEVVATPTAAVTAEGAAAVPADGAAPAAAATAAAPEAAAKEEKAKK